MRDDPERRLTGSENSKWDASAKLAVAVMGFVALGSLAMALLVLFRS